MCTPAAKQAEISLLENLLYAEMGLGVEFAGETRTAPRMEEGKREIMPLICYYHIARANIQNKIFSHDSEMIKYDPHGNACDLTMPPIFAEIASIVSKLPAFTKRAVKPCLFHFRHYSDSTTRVGGGRISVSPIDETCCAAADDADGAPYESHKPSGNSAEPQLPPAQGVPSARPVQVPSASADHYC